jgi:hypothetical protein
MLRKIIKEQLLLEKKIAQIKSNITINYDLRHDERNDHSQKRKWRHVGETGGEKIYDFDWVLYVISVMNKKDYKIGKGQLQIFK